MQNNGKHTIPSDLCYRFEPLNVKLAHAIRECNSNAENYGATEAGTWIIHYEGRDMFLYAHTGKRFVNGDDILNNGCVPNVTTSQGAAFQGCGLVATAYAASREPKLIVASVCEDGKFHAGAGFPTPPNWWQTKDETKIWKPVLEKFLGGRHLGKFNVFYLFPLTLHTVKEKSARNFLTSDVFLQTAFIAPSMLAGNLKVFYCEKELGFPYDLLKDRKKYATFEKAFQGDTSSARRKSISLDAYLRRYQEDGDEFRIPCDPFRVNIKKFGKVYLEIDKATIHVHLFDFKKAPGSKAWYVTVRAGEDHHGKFGKGKQLDYGHKLSKYRNFLTCPWIASKVEQDQGPEIAKQYSRFKDNALVTYRNSDALMSALGLPYNDGDATPIIYVEIENVKTIIDEDRGTKEEPTARAIMEMFGRRPDFTFESSETMHEVMRAACEAAAPHVDQRLKDRCSTMFHYEMGDFLDFDFEFDFENGPRRRRKATREKMVQVFDMGKGGREFKGIFRAGETKQLAIWHLGLQEWVSHLDIDPSTRGVDVKLIPERRYKDYANVKDAVQWFKENDEENPGENVKIPVFNVSVSKLGQVDDDGVFHPIKRSEYEHNASFVPSRKIVLLCGEDHINFLCKDVPKKERNANTQPPEGLKTLKFDGNGRQKKKTSIFNQREDSEAWFTYEPKTGILKLNTLTEWVHFHYKTRSNALRGSKVYDDLRELYLTFKAMASNLHQQFTNLGLRLTQEENIANGYNDAFDWFLNTTLRGELIKNPLFIKMMKKIDNELGRTRDTDEDVA
jgi:hypothetical protein